MFTSVQNITSSQIKPNNSHVRCISAPRCELLLTVIAIITFTGSLIASGFLFSYLGLAAFGIPIASLLISITLLVSRRLCVEKPPLPVKSTPVASTTSIAALTSTPQPQEKPPITVNISRALEIYADESYEEPEWNFSETAWLENHHLRRYMVYLAIRNPQIAFTSYPHYDCRIKPEAVSNEHFVSLEDNVFKCLPSINQDALSKNLPIFLHVTNNHWALVYIDRQKRTVEYYDSKMAYGNHDEIIAELQRVTNLLSQENPDQTPYTFHSKISKSLQPDLDQCGCWLLYFLEKRLEDPEFDFNSLDENEAQNMIANYRSHIREKLLELYHLACDVKTKELEYYQKLYGDANTAEVKRREYLSQFSYIDHWKRIISRELSVPS